MSNKQDLSDEDPLKMVAVAGPAEAQMIEEFLKNNGIVCALQGNYVAPTWPTVSDLDEVRVFVKRSDLSRAEEFIEGFFTPVGKNELVEAESELGVDDPEKPGGFTI